MARKDDYYNRAKQEGYRARSAYKLKQIDSEVGLFDDGAVVVDLGAAPGGWMQVAAEKVGKTGTVVGVDRQRIDPLEDTEATVELLRGDITEEETHERITSTVESVTGIQPEGKQNGPVDVVLSDMAPNMSGDYDLDHARSVYLAKQAANVGQAVLRAGGDLVIKVFQGRDLDDLEAELEEDFEYVRRYTPEASRDESSEIYLIARSFLTAPVRPGDELTVEITDTGQEGDGITTVEGYTLFVSGANEGESIDVRVTDCKANFGFAERI
ncbi:TRAM domain-containing protein [Salinarchaeum sp. IM2453]|uniref:23S rRNA (uridine(2552)-2'-O)-methyltransferase n=1 Tax=Salinarchaeum sp. IM2453 TaxID=2862870 RepID=UPI001C837071|nr:23S rRNA (uridine(2552)-2'-O)-methyltransferase [Salinarchaeum sp. IM2453]QZA89291.1 TRAM domain-containing protein [Salinarchaeum sp. IM2453]